MRKDTRIAYNRLLDRIAQLSGVPSAKEQFAIEPSVQQTLESKIQESSEFLSSVNIIGVDELKGQKLGLGVTGPIASRTDTTQKDRTTSDVSSLESHDYECVATEFDTHITWAKLDAWAKFPDFQTRVRNAIVRQQALDRIMVGLNGTTAAAETDRVANPLLQDVNIGWLQQYRTHAPARVLSEGANAGEVRVGPSGDYENLDALVYDVVNEMLDPWFRESTDIRAICGRKILADKYFPLINQEQAPTEQRALDMILSQKRMGGQQAARVPFMPDGTLLITPPENLSLYWQNGSRRRYLEDNPKRNRIENYESSNDAYVIEDYGFGCLVENIVFGDWSV
ncbi:phage major capsid protein, P2 family [Halomonas llamarensis]|uniref:Phage major capsid protein, P2 family n=1 Tax=Halomonas llamarensis TaxID=2945104 RepID=A0ABT0SSG8_9GAMM|nr:phage major capsid protein, P2 family [Halomonas llamarensis]MCL7930425.1 phage major capsid protein, P2 family [Halomonas llamarensis]